MGETADKHDDPSSQCFSKISLLYVAVFLVSSSLIWVCLGFSSFLVTISILCLSSIFLLTVSNNKKSNPPPANEEVEQKVNQAVTLLPNAAQETEVRDFQDYQVESTDCPTASESSSDDFSASEDFELNWTCFDNLGKNVAVSEILVFSSSCNDDDDEEEEDDNLIEINFPDSSSAELNDESEEKLQIDFAYNDESEAKMQTQLPESVFRQEGFMELLEEINDVTEEENLIEIDLSMGSIKGQNH